jgi:glucose-6-phosphate isomerase
MLRTQWNEAALALVNEGQPEQHSSFLRDIITDTLGSTTKDTPFYKVLHSGSIDKSLEAYSSAASNIKQNFDHVIVIGMGGAALNPKSLIKFFPFKKSPKLYFLDTTDPIKFHLLMSGLDLHRSLFICVSNSGETIETISLLKAVLHKYEETKISNLASHFIFITNPKDNSLKSIADHLGSKILGHPEQISGRYSSFSNVVTFPGLILGLNMAEYLEGATSVLDEFWDKKELSSPAFSASMIWAAGKPALVNIGYLGCFSGYLEWFSQIIAESLGKEDKGFTPINNIAPEVHHSLFQLYLAGPKDKLYSLFYVENLVDQPLRDLNNNIFSAAALALNEANLPMRQVILKDISERSLGALVAHSIIEVILLGKLLNINPFDQPEVEMIKKNLKLANSR